MEDVKFKERNWEISSEECNKVVNDICNELIAILQNEIVNHPNDEEVALPSFLKRQAY